MRTYCKAYQLKDLRNFSAWAEKPSDPQLTDEDIVYLWDDFIVVKNPFETESILFDAVTPEWQEFCKTTLNFEVPEDVRAAAELQQDSQAS